MLEIAKTLTQSKVSQNYILGVKKKTNSVKGCSQQKQQTRRFNCCCFFFLFYLYSKVKMSRHGSYKVTVLLAFSCFHCFKPSTSHWWFGLSVFSVHGSKPFISSSCLCDTHVMWRPREEGGRQEPPKKGGGSGGVCRLWLCWLAASTPVSLYQWEESLMKHDRTTFHSRVGTHALKPLFCSCSRQREF